MQIPDNSTQLLPETTWNNETLPSGIPAEGKVVVTITRQFGSGGAEIGHLVSEKSQLLYVDRSIIERVASRLGVDMQHVEKQDEQTTSLTSHFYESVKASNPFFTNYSSFFGRSLNPLQSEEIAYLRLTQRVILEAATEGNAVIIGRGSQFLLHNVPRTLHTYIFAPLPYRIEHVMRQYQFSHEQAVRLIEQRDYEHDSYLRRNYGTDGHQPGLYHLLINTSLFSQELAADLICQALPVVRELLG